jgi:hypothetical protein
MEVTMWNVHGTADSGDLLTDEDTVVFTEGGTVAHVLPWNKSPNSEAEALCGRTPWPRLWHGTGNQEEWERARELTLCVRCEAILKHQRLAA